MSLLSILGLSKKNPHELEIKFHTEANHFGEHGEIVVTHKKKGLVEEPVRFVFVGVTTPPKLDARTFDQIWTEAKNQGYIPHHIACYGKDGEVVQQALDISDTSVLGGNPATDKSMRISETQVKSTLRNAA